MKRIVIGIMAHVDAGKTTLSEALLYQSGSIRKMGRVDNQDAFLDTYALERERGITIFSKQARICWNDFEITLLDTPGHIDFSAEMERTLQVLDYAVLLISGTDGIQGHTLTLWRLLKKYRIPTFIFVNKMDQSGTDRQLRMQELRSRLDGGCIDFISDQPNEVWEEIAVADERMLERFLETGELQNSDIQELIGQRKIFPVYFGSALKDEGIDVLLQGIRQYTAVSEYPPEFGAKVYKIARDEQGSRLTYMKITGGQLKVRQFLEEQQEKITQIRIYSGERYVAAEEVYAGQICAVTGLSDTRSGQGLGWERDGAAPVIEPVLTYRVILPPGAEEMVMFPKLKELSEEDPSLHIVWNELMKEIQVQIMGQVQLEILKRLIKERLGIEVLFGTGSILYKETIMNPVEGIGHYEPLRHYAEVHLILSPGEPGSGVQIQADCSEDMLDRNWQRLILSHLHEKEHIGVLTGAPVTDMIITLVAGRAHKKHTEGGDFREATFRAVRQGLCKAQSVLLEPVYEYTLEVPEQMVGRGMADLERMHGSFAAPEFIGGVAVLTGEIPAAAIGEYQQEVTVYTKGTGKLFYTLKGYKPCHNTEEIILQRAYRPEEDGDNPAGSVFCSHGAGFYVPWNQVEKHMHIEAQLLIPGEEEEDSAAVEKSSLRGEKWIGTDEIDAIIEKTFYANRKERFIPHKGISGKSRKAADVPSPVNRSFKPSEQKEDYLLVDGYNIIYAWDELKELAQVNLDGARGRLQDILSNYQAVRQCRLIVVFDAYRIQGGQVKSLDYHNIHIVFTREAETADQYIERFAQENKEKYNVTVATSDGLEQIIIRGAGCALLSARELREEVIEAGRKIQAEYDEMKKGEQKAGLFADLSEEVIGQINEIE